MARAGANSPMGVAHARALVAAADGRRSPLRQAAGIRALDMGLSADRHRLHRAPCRPHHGVAVEHFLPAGPFAILPMTGQRSSIVWTERADAGAGDAGARRRRVSSPSSSRRFGDFLGELEVVGPRWSYPLSLLHATRYVAPRLALVGDAAHVIHPIAGQGLNLGIRDVAALAELIVDARRLGLDIGDRPTCSPATSAGAASTIAASRAVTDGLNRLFSNTLPPVRLARDLGLAAVDRMPPLKRLLHAPRHGHARRPAAAGARRAALIQGMILRFSQGVDFSGT